MIVTISGARSGPGSITTRLILLLIFLVPVLDVESRTASAQGDVACDRFASAAGDDSNPGTADAPVSSIRRLADVLDAGETGCLAAGDEFVSPGDGSGSIGASGDANNPITLRSGPGGRATMRGQFEVTGNNVILRDLDFLGYVPSAANPNFKGKFLNVLGDNVQILDNDITSEFGICVGAGSLPNNDQAKNFILDGNRIHGCGLGNAFVPSDSGSHGAYIEHTLDAQITNNYFYDNRVRGLQLYPKAINTYVANNVLDGNSGNLNIGGENGNYPRDTLVENNIITNSTFQGNAKDEYDVFGYYPNNGETYGNVIRDNCVFNEDHPSQLFGGYGYVGDETDNIVADPLYVDADDKNFSLQPESPCAGKGPDTSAAPETSTDVGNDTGDNQEEVRLTILNVDENDEPLVHSCFQIYEEGVDIFTASPLADLCDGQDETVDGQVTFALEPGMYILHQSWVDVDGYIAVEPQTITVDSESEQTLTIQSLPQGQDSNGTDTDSNGGSYESPTYGYTLTYDDDTWDILFEDGDPSDPYDEIYLYNGTSIIGLTGDPDYEATNLDDCIDDYVRSMGRDDANSEIAPMSSPDAAGSTADAAWATYTYVYTDDTGEESDWIRYFECRAIGGGVTLVITQDVPSRNFEDQVGIREELLYGLDLPR